ncbi:ABC transporter substrate-binding protein [Paraliobacillus sediminis]|uniref:ABC transporter substrate-binding protein n=1 Tax=Paraliobacillus sediminis TaxID=1885916 RepID=UPI000E3D74CA|nr:sugar ABC transporter substrate-binding protein [Paraliobacillus sediminis]
MNKKSYRVLTALLLISILLLSACAGGGSDSSSGSEDDGGDKELTFMFRGGEAEEEAYSKVIDQFEEKNPGVTVKMIVTAADQYATKLKASITGKQVPDVFYIDPGSVRSYVHSNVLLDLTEFVESNDDINLDNIWQYGVDSYRFDGETQGQGSIYAMPKDVGPFSLGYNKTMLEEAGIDAIDKDVPLTWDEFIEINQAVTQDTDGDGTIDNYGTGFNINWVLQSFVWSNGGDFLDETQTKVTVDTPEFAEALQWFADHDLKYGITPSVEDAQTLDTYQRWMQGQLAFFPVAPWDLATFDTELDFDYDVIPYPAGKTGESATWIGSLGIAVGNDTEHPDLATELVYYLTASEEGQQALSDARVQIPNLKDMAVEWAADETMAPANKEEYLQIVEDYGRALPANNTYNAEWYDYFFTNVQPVLDGDMTAAEYVKDIQPKMQEFLDNAIQLEEQSK